MKTLSFALAALIVGMASLAAADDFDEAPINYRDSTPNDRVAKLLQRMASGEADVKGENALESLGKLLKEMHVPQSSQVLVFSKTSLQRHRIAPQTPRAIYFSDDCYVGYCEGSEVMEISTVDPQLGAVFYTAERHDDGTLEVQRQNDNCLICHGSSQTRQIPGHLVRSVYTDRSGLPLLSMGSHRTDHSSPLAERWGGWYVTGTHGEQKHLGNLLLGKAQRPEEVDNAAGQNVTSLEKLFDVSNYLTPHSDLVALMVLEHQTEGHNRITRAGFQCRQALHQQEQLNKELGKPADYIWDSTKSRIKSASEDLVKYLLFCDEAPLRGKLTGTSKFADEFASPGPRDDKNRSLRDLDLEKRVFQHPLSFLIYTEAFDALPPQVREHVWKRIWEVVTGQDKSEDFQHLSAEDRQAIHEILLATKQKLPDYWRQQHREVNSK
jgi:hypothetical protein